MPEYDQNKERSLRGETSNSSSSDESISRKVEEAARLVAIGSKTELRDAEIVGISRNTSSLTQITTVPSSSHDGYPLPENIVDLNARSQSDHVRNQLAKRKEMLKKVA